MSTPPYPHRGTIPWDKALKEYIDYGDNVGVRGPAGPEGPVGDQGLPGVPGGDTVQSMWTWEVLPVSPPMDPGLIGVVDPPPREATELITSCHDIYDIEHSETLQALKPGDRIHLQVPNNPNSWHTYEVLGLPIDSGSFTYCIPVCTYSGSSPDTAPTDPVTVLTAFQFVPQPGPQGPEGPPGPPGPQGPSGTVYTYTQLEPSVTWIITHDLGKYSSVTVVDSGDTVLVPDVHYDNVNQVTILFSSPTSGKAYLS